MPQLPQGARSLRPEEPRKSSAQRGYDSAWRKVRDEYIRDNPLCEVCSAENRDTLAEEVDHRLPMANGGARLDRRNLQSLCRTCHETKTRGENRARAASYRFGSGRVGRVKYLAPAAGDPVRGS